MFRTPSQNGIPVDDKGQPIELPKGSFTVTYDDTCYIFDDEESYQAFNKDMNALIKEQLNKRFDTIAESLTAAPS